MHRQWLCRMQVPRGWHGSHSTGRGRYDRGGGRWGGDRRVKGVCMLQGMRRGAVRGAGPRGGGMPAGVRAQCDGCPTAGLADSLAQADGWGGRWAPRTKMRYPGMLSAKSGGPLIAIGDRLRGPGRARSGGIRPPCRRRCPAAGPGRATAAAAGTAHGGGLVGCPATPIAH